MVDLEALFFKAYSQLIDDERSQIIAVIDGKSYTWDRACDEIKAKTHLGKKILNKLRKLGILNE